MGFNATITDKMMMKRDKERDKNERKRHKHTNHPHQLNKTGRKKSDK